MIEALVAAVLFSVGVLAVFGLQGAMASLQADSQYRSEAVDIESDLSGRMWTDLTNLSSFAGTNAASNSYITDNYSDWVSKLERLPNGKVSITVDSDEVTIEVTWAAADNETHQYTAYHTMTR